MSRNSYQSLRETAEARNHDRMLKAMFDCCQEAIFAFDQVGLCKLVNAAGVRLTGGAPEEWVGRSYKQLCGDEDGEKLEALFKRALQGIAGDCTITLVHKNGTPCSVDLIGNPLELGGEVQGVFFTARVLREFTEREIHYAAAQKVAHLGSWELVVSSGGLYWSDEMYRIFGLERGDVELTYEAYLQHVHPEDVELVRTAVEEALTGGTCAVEYRILWPDGTVRVIIAQGEAVIDAAGRSVKLVGVIQDITERRQEQERLREIEHRYKVIAENAQDIIFYYTPDHVIRFVSPAARSLLGFEPEEMIGRKMSEYVHADDVPYLGFREDLEINVSTYRVRHRDGHYIWFETIQKFIRNADGTPRKTLGIARDITERLQADEELRATKEQLEAFIEYNADAIVLYDCEGHLQKVNPAFEQMYGWTLEELRGQHVLELPIIPEALRHVVESMTEQAQQGQSTVGSETKRLTKSGVELDVLLSLSPTCDAVGNVSGWSVIMRDISEHKKAEQLLLQTEKLSIAGQLAAGIAHEIRNPLTALKGFTQLLKADAARQEKYLSIMESEMSRIELILSELLVLAKPQAERYLLADLGPIVEEVRALIESQAIMHSIEIQCEVEPELPMISCDQNQLKQVFINFLKNAIEAMEGGGVIRVEVRREGEGQVLVRFVDQGCGISKARLARLGEPFYTTKEHGTGLGWMVSKRIIETHRGQLHVESEVGVGTTIEVRFPWGEGEV